MRIIFAGSPEFSAAVFSALLKAPQLQHLQWVGALTQPDRPQGRGLVNTPSAVKQVAEKYQIEVQTPKTLSGKDDESTFVIQWLERLKPDLIIVVAYGLILPKIVLDIPRYGCVNLHASLLPRWRGAAPIQRALAANDSETGVCLMKMEPGLDTGPVWAESRISITGGHNFQTLQDDLIHDGILLLTDFIARDLYKTSTPFPQSNFGVTYAHKITSQDRWISFERSALEVYGQVRSLDPLPGARCLLKQAEVKLGNASVIEKKGVWGVPGEIIRLPTHDAGLVVACEEGLVSFGVMQKSGGKKMSSEEFCRGNRILEGYVLETGLS